MSKSLGICLDSIDERSMLRSLHTQDNTNVQKNVNIYPCTSGNKKQEPVFQKLGAIYTLDPSGL